MTTTSVQATENVLKKDSPTLVQTITGNPSLTQAQPQHVHIQQQIIQTMAQQQVIDILPKIKNENVLLNLICVCVFFYTVPATNSTGSTANTTAISCAISVNIAACIKQSSG